MEVPDLWMENAHNCFLTGNKTEMDSELNWEHLAKEIEKRKQEYFLPKFKLLIEECKCSPFVCFGKLGGWNESEYPYCINKENALMILNRENVAEKVFTDCSCESSSSDVTCNRSDSCNPIESDCGESDSLF